MHIQCGVPHQSVQAVLQKKNCASRFTDYFWCEHRVQIILWCTAWYTIKYVSLPWSSRSTFFHLSFCVRKEQPTHRTHNYRKNYCHNQATSGPSPTAPLVYLTDVVGAAPGRGESSMPKLALNSDVSVFEENEKKKRARANRNNPRRSAKQLRVEREKFK